jgi:hypothetical protein
VSRAANIVHKNCHPERSEGSVFQADSSLRSE